jgi:dTDP-4-amino-4,6-dideoxygalactose transaminase
MNRSENIPVFYPFMPKNAARYVTETLSTRWIGQGPKVDKFENLFSEKFCSGNSAIAVSSGTAALHMAYLMAGIKKGDEVITPVYTSPCTNIPLSYIGAKVIFADIEQDTLNISVDHVKKIINEKTKAIICVHNAGLPCDMDELQEIADKWHIPLIEDAAHAIGASYKGRSIGSMSDYTVFSFQATKHITTGDGGMLTFKDKNKRNEAEKLRWFGVDKSVKRPGGSWDNDISESGYKYQMTDIAASMGIAGLEEIDEVVKYRRKLFSIYEKELRNIPGIKLAGAGYTDRVHVAWLCTVIADNRQNLQQKLKENKVEANQVHYRNDRYSLFGGRRENLSNMDAIEDKYMILPLNTHVSGDDVKYVCDVIRSGW